MLGSLLEYQVDLINLLQEKNTYKIEDFLNNLNSLTIDEIINLYEISLEYFFNLKKDDHYIFLYQAFMRFLEKRNEFKKIYDLNQIEIEKKELSRIPLGDILRNLENSTLKIGEIEKLEKVKKIRIEYFLKRKNFMRLRKHYARELESDPLLKFKTSIICNSVSEVREQLARNLNFTKINENQQVYENILEFVLERFESIKDLPEVGFIKLFLTLKGLGFQENKRIIFSELIETILIHPFYLPNYGLLLDVLKEEGDTKSFNLALSIVQELLNSQDMEGKDIIRKYFDHYLNLTPELDEKLSDETKNIGPDQDYTKVMTEVYSKIFGADTLFELTGATSLIDLTMLEHDIKAPAREIKLESEINDEEVRFLNNIFTQIKLMDEMNLKELENYFVFFEMLREYDLQLKLLNLYKDINEEKISEKFYHFEFINAINRKDHFKAKQITNEVVLIKDLSIEEKEKFIRALEKLNE